MASQPVPAGSQQKFIEAIDLQTAQALVTASKLDELTLTMDSVTALLHEFGHAIDGATAGRWVLQDDNWACGRCGYRLGIGRSDQEWSDRIEIVLSPK
jgi:hypothetical protein